MKKLKAKTLFLALCLPLLLIPCAMAAPASTDTTAFIKSFMDAFNRGDMKTVNASYATGDITIVDEFAPHLWTGTIAASAWAADFKKDASATGKTDSRMKFTRAPARTQLDGDLAYVVYPMTYLYNQHGKAITEPGQMTFVLHQESGAWKVRSWIWSGTNPHPARS